MPFPVVLAHGALGNFDELIFLGVGVIFLVMMGISWVKSRNVQPEFKEEAAPTPEAAPDSEAPDHYRLG